MLVEHREHVVIPAVVQLPGRDLPQFGLLLVLEAESVVGVEGGNVQEHAVGGLGDAGQFQVD